MIRFSWAAEPPDGDHPDGGFTLIELLVVMIIIGILAAIAIPVITDQRGKARDAATRQDAARLGKSVADYFLANTATPTLDLTSGRFDLSGEDLGEASAGVVAAGASASAVDTSGWTSSAWCFALTNPDGSLQTFKFSAASGLEQGTCSSSTAP